MKNLKIYQEKAELLKALAHPTRLCIVHGLMENECNVSKIKDCLNAPQSTVSQQLGILRNKEIIEGKRKGIEICYSVKNPTVRQLVGILMNSRDD